MNIRCGHCKGRHDDVRGVQACSWGITIWDEPIEVCCGICDALKGYAYNEEDMSKLNRTGCGCDGMKGMVRPLTVEELDAKALSLPQRPAHLGGCGCDSGNGVYCNAHRRSLGLGLTRAYND